MQLIEFKTCMPFKNCHAISLVGTHKKGHSQISLKMSYTYH